MNTGPRNYSDNEHLTAGRQADKKTVDLAAAYISKVNAAVEESREDLVAELDLAYQADLEQTAR